MASQASPSSASVDPVSIWLRSQILDSPEKKERNDFVQKTNVASRYAGERSAMWTSLSEMTGPNRQQFITKMIQNWPIDLERRAMLFPNYIGALSVMTSTIVISNRIIADMFLFDPKAGFLETIRKGPKSPWVFPTYTSGLAFFGFYSLYIMKPFVSEDDPCPSCALSRLSSVLIGTGVILPTATVPALAHYVNMQKYPDLPGTKNMLEFFTMIYTASKPCWSVLPKLIVLQVAVASVCTYSLLWGRQRIFNTLDMEQDLMNEALVKAQKHKSFKQWTNYVFSKVTFLRPFVDDITAEE